MEPRQYSKSEIRAVRIFLIVLLAIGMFLLVGGLANLHKWPSNGKEKNTTSEADVKSTDAKTSRKEKRRSYRNVPLMYFIFRPYSWPFPAPGFLP